MGLFSLPFIILIIVLMAILQIAKLIDDDESLLFLYSFKG